jgi:hypothetical protein
VIPAGRRGTLLLAAACGTATVAPAGCGGSSATACKRDAGRSPTTPSSSEPLTQTTEFYAFGVPVHVIILPSDEVEDVTDEFKSKLS